MIKNKFPDTPINKSKTVRKFVCHKNIIIKFCGLYLIGLLIFIAAWFISFYFFPEGLMRDTSLASRLAGSDISVGIGKELTRIFVVNLIMSAVIILFTNQALRKMFENGMKEAFKQGATGWVGDVFTGISWRFTPEEIQIPVKIFHGSADELLFAEMGRRLAQRLPHADFQLYEGEGHCCIFKHWSEILSAFSQGQE